jgi:hypothetical protein
MLFDTDEDYLARIFGFGIGPKREEVIKWFQRLRTTDACLQWGHRDGSMAVEAMKKEALAIRDLQDQEVKRFYCDYWPTRNNSSGKYGHSVVLEKDSKASYGYELRDYRERFAPRIVRL